MKYPIWLVLHKLMQQKQPSRCVKLSSFGFLPMLLVTTVSSNIPAASNRSTILFTVITLTLLKAVSSLR
jgi:hypothetical protein